MLLDDGGKGTRHADTVATHEEGLLNAVLIGEGGAHGVGVLGAELEGLAHLDAAGAGEGLAAAGARVAGLGGGDVGVLGLGEVDAALGSDEVVVGLVGAADPALLSAQRLVGKHAHLVGDALGADEALDEAAGDKLFLVHHAPLAEAMFEGALVDLVVAGHEHDPALAVVGDEGEGLDRLVGGNLEERGDVLDGTAARRVDLLAGSGLAHREMGTGLGGLDVGGVAALAVHELGLAGLGKCHELGRDLAADLAGVGLNGSVVDTAALAHAGIGAVHVLVSLLEALVVGMEGVGVLHDELTAAQQAEARARLVAELVLNLVERHGQLLVGAQLVAHEVGESLLVRRAQAELAVVTVGDAHELGAVVVPAARLVPELGGREDGEHELLGVDGVHLLAHDLLDLEQRAPSEGQVGVQARGGLADAAGAQQQAVAGDVGVLGILTQRGGVQARHPHVRAGHVNRAPILGNERQGDILAVRAHSCRRVRNVPLSQQRAPRRSGRRARVERSRRGRKWHRSHASRPRRCRRRGPRRGR